MSKNDIIFLTCWSIYMGTLFLIWIFKKDENKSSTDTNYTNCNTGYHLKSSKVAYVKAVVYWCVQNLGVFSGNKKIPNVLIKYVKQEKLLGVYCPVNKVIIIYIHAHQNLLQLTNTVIHEYDHFMRIRNVKDQKHYTKLLNEIGYDQHPLEIYARQTADKYEIQCFKAMVEKGLISKNE